MPGYIIHIAIGKQYAQKNKITDLNDFIKGIIMPDLLDKRTSHYGNDSSCPNLKKFLAENNLDSDYNKGYFLHLITDYLFYNKFLECFSEKLYSDYNKLNQFLIKKYHIENIPPEIQDCVGFESGEPVILKPAKICKVIDAVSDLDLSQLSCLNNFYIKEETETTR